MIFVAGILKIGSHKLNVFLANFSVFLVFLFLFTDPIHFLLDSLLTVVRFKCKEFQPEFWIEQKYILSRTIFCFILDDGKVVFNTSKHNVHYNHEKQLSFKDLLLLKSYVLFHKSGTKVKVARKSRES